MATKDNLGSHHARNPPFLAPVLALFLAGFATFSLLYCVQPLLPVLATQFAVTPAQSSLALSLTTISLAPAILIAAALSDSLGRRGLMFASMAAASAINLAVAFAPGWSTLLALRALEGAALGGVPAIAMAYLAEEIEPSRLGRAMGLYVGGTAFGGMCGRVGTGILTHLGGWRLAIGTVGAIGLITSLAFVILLPPSRNFTPRPGFDPRYHAAAWRSHATRPAMLLLYAISFLAMGAFVAVYNFASFRLMAPPYALNQIQLGLIFTIYLFGVAASPLAGTLADRFGRDKILSIAILVTASGIALTLLPGLPAMIAGLTLLTIGFFATHATASAWVGRLAATTKGHASSLYLLAYYLGSSTIGSTAGYFLRTHGWPGVVTFTTTALAIALACALSLRKQAVFLSKEPNPFVTEVRDRAGKNSANVERNKNKVHHEGTKKKNIHEGHKEKRIVK